MKRIKRFITHSNRFQHTRQERGAGIIVVILVMTFLLGIGLVLLTVTSTGSKVAGNIRTQQQAFNAAEAGFDSAWIAIENSFVSEVWTSFDGHYLTEPSGIDIPISDSYFRKLTDQELLNLIDPEGDGTPNVANVIFCRQIYVPAEGGGLNPRFTYTAFLIDDEAGGGTPDATDALLVCIGSVGTGRNMTSTRLEIELAVELEGMN